MKQTNFIFDTKEIYELKNFTIDILPNKELAIGLLLPKWKDVKVGKKKYVKTQVYSPAIITSNKKLIDLESVEVESKFKIKYKVIPTDMKLNWQLEEVGKYLDGKNKETQFKEIFENVKLQYKNYMYFGNEVWYNVHALWDLATYFFYLFDYFPIFELRGKMQAGKTKIMDISRSVSFNPTELMINPTEASLFRETHEKRPTKYLDECEKMFKFTGRGIEADSRVELINSSIKKGATVPRIETVNKKFHTVYYDTYSPTMVGSINGLYGATEDRALIHVCVRNPDGDERGELEPNLKNKEWQELRNKCYLLLLQRWNNVLQTYNALKKEDLGLKKRQYWLWLPLLTIAKLVSQVVFDEVLVFAKKLSSIKKLNTVQEGSYEYKICKYIKEQLDKGASVFLIQEIKDSIFAHLGEKKPSNKTIGRMIDNLGFYEYKEHFTDGNGYRFSSSSFRDTLLPILPSLFSSDSSYSSSPLNPNELPIINEEYVSEN